MSYAPILNKSRPLARQSIESIATEELECAEAQYGSFHHPEIEFGIRGDTAAPIGRRRSRCEKKQWAFLRSLACSLVGLTLAIGLGRGSYILWRHFSLGQEITEGDTHALPGTYFEHVSPIISKTKEERKRKRKSKKKKVKTTAAAIPVVVDPPAITVNISVCDSFQTSCTTNFCDAGGVFDSAFLGDSSCATLMPNSTTMYAVATLDLSTCIGNVDLSFVELNCGTFFPQSDVSGVTDVDLQNLQYADNLDLSVYTNAETVNLSSLQVVTTLTITGLSNLVSLDLSGLTEVSGDLSLQDLPALKDLRLPSLYFVGPSTSTTGRRRNLLQGATQSFYLRDNGNLTTFEAPLLNNVTGDLIVHDNPLLTILSFPNLQTVSGDLKIDAECPECPGRPNPCSPCSYGKNSKLVTVSMPNLLQWNGDTVRFQYMAFLENLILSSLQRTTSLFVLDTLPSLINLDLSRLQISKGGFFINTVDALQNFDLPQLISNQKSIIEIGTMASLISASFPLLNETGELDFYELPEFTGVSAPNLKIIRSLLYIQTNPKLVNLELPAVETVGNVEIKENPLLETISMPSVTLAYGANYYNANPAIDRRKLEIKDNLVLSSLNFPLLSNISAKVDIPDAGQASITSCIFPSGVSVYNCVASPTACAPNLDCSV